MWVGASHTTSCALAAVRSPVKYLRSAQLLNARVLNRGGGDVLGLLNVVCSRMWQQMQPIRLEVRMATMGPSALVVPLLHRSYELDCFS